MIIISQTYKVITSRETDNKIQSTPIQIKKNTDCYKERIIQWTTYKI